MAGNDDLFKAIQMFSNSAQQLAIQRAISGANEQVGQIRASELKEEQKRAELENVSRGLVAQMAGIGAPATTIQQVAGALGPKQFSSPGAAAIEGVLSGDKRLVEAAGQADVAAQQGNLAQLKQQQQFQAEQSALNRDLQLQLAGMKANKRGGMTTNEINKIQEFDQVHVKGEALLEKLGQDSSLVGPIAGRAPGRSLLDPDFDSFRAESGRFFDSYRVQVTGAGASPGELKILERNVPSITDRPENYKKKLETMLKVGEMVKRRYLENLKKGGRDVSGFTGVEDSPRAPQGQLPAADWSSFIKK